MLNPMRDKKIKARTAGEKGRHVLPRLVQNIAEGETSYELGWKAKVVINKKNFLSMSFVMPRPRL